MKRFFRILIGLVLFVIVIVAVVLVGIYTSHIPIKFGKYEDNVKWKYYVNKTLKVEGNGSIAFANDDGEAYFPEDIENLVISEGITGIKSDYRVKNNNKGISEKSISNNNYSSSDIRSVVVSQDLVVEREDYDEFKAVYKNIVNIHLPDSVKEIGDYAFLCFPELNEINIPKNIEKIDEYAFWNCKKIESLDISETKIESFDFLKNIENLKDLNVAHSNINANKIPSQVEKLNMPNNTVLNMNFITNLTNLREVNMSGCKISRVEYGNEMPISLEKIDLTDATISQYENLNFKDCIGLREVKLPKTCTQINVAMFDGCKSLEKIDLPENIKEIKSYAFQECANLKEIILPDSLEKIGDWVFEKCTSLTDIEIPYKTFSIGKYAFKDCKSLINVTSKNRNVNIDETAFSNCDKFKEVVYTDEGQKKLIDVVNVGDYVSYNPGSKYIENMDKYQGVKISGIIKAEEMNGSKKWQVLSKDIEKGTIELVASDITSQTVEFAEISGYNNSEEALNEICSIYANEEAGAISARCLNIGDVNKITNYTPSGEDVSCTYKTKYELDNETLEIIEKTDMGEYTYNMKSESIEYSYSRPDMFLKPSKTCWLASRCIGLEANNKIRHIKIRTLNSMMINSESLGFFLSEDSGTKFYTRSNSYLPVVVLKANIQTSGINSEGEWVLVNN